MQTSLRPARRCARSSAMCQPWAGFPEATLFSSPGVPAARHNRRSQAGRKHTALPVARRWPAVSPDDGSVDLASVTVGSSVSPARREPTTSPSKTKLSKGRRSTALAMSGNVAVKSLPARERSTASPFSRPAISRYPSYLSSKQPAGFGERLTCGLGEHDFGTRGSHMRAWCVEFG